MNVPLRRTLAQGADGSAPPATDCARSYAFDFNAWLQAGNDPSIQPGDRINAQFWMRDPDHPDGSGLGMSNAHERDLQVKKQ